MSEPALQRRFAAAGAGLVRELNGLFSGLLFDPQRGCVSLFNDRYGSERIYYYETADALFFASEAKALLSVLPAARAFDDTGVAQLLAYGSTLDNRTLFQGIRLLPGGSLWTFGPGGTITKERYFRPAEWETQPLLDEAAFEEEFAAVFRKVLPEYLEAPHQPVGISITGGLDTRMIMACLPADRSALVVYTYAGLAGETLDVRIGRQVAQQCGIPHHTLRLGSDFLDAFGAQVDRTVFETDGTAGPLAAHELYYTELGRALSPVRLTGNYGSEILRGVSTFKPLRIAGDLLDPAFAQHFAVIEGDRRDGGHPVTHAAFAEIPWHLFGPLAAARRRVTVRSPFLDNRIVKLAYQAPACARRAPRAALQLISRSNPALGRIPSDRGLIAGRRDPFAWARRLFCEATFKLDWLYADGLPHRLSRLEPMIRRLDRAGLLGLHKFLPYRAWFRRELADYVGAVLHAAQTQQMPFWNARLLPVIHAHHRDGRRNYTREIHLILTLEAVDRLLLRGWDPIPAPSSTACEGAS